MKSSKGITLVSLIITVVIMLIITGVTVVITFGVDGFFNKVQNAGETYKNEIEKEGELIGTLSEIYVKIPTVYDKTGEIEEKLHIGDFVNYDAGTWTADEIAEVQVGLKGNLTAANNSLEMPTESYQFGGFTAGFSRNETSKIALFSGLGTVEYIRNAATNEPISGWRIFDINEETGKVTLISAGDPEAFHVGSENNVGYKSQYILSGEVHTSWNEEEAKNYEIRDWSHYVNSNMKAERAYILSEPQLKAWYNKYVGTVTDLWNKTQFRSIYSKERLHNVIDNYSFWWLSTNRDNKGISAGLHFVQGDVDRRLRGGGSVTLGIRVMVELSPDVLVTSERVGTIELTSEAHMNATYGGNQTYNCWKIK